MNYSKGAKSSALGVDDQKADLDISWGTKPTVVQPCVGSYADVALLQSFPDAAMSSYDERFNRGLYRERNRVERLINRLKQFRRIATRYRVASEQLSGDVNYCGNTVVAIRQYKPSLLVITFPICLLTNF
jgi:hypothetical protein